MKKAGKSTAEQGTLTEVPVKNRRSLLKKGSTSKLSYKTPKLLTSNNAARTAPRKGVEPSKRIEAMGKKVDPKKKLTTKQLQKYLNEATENNEYLAKALREKNHQIVDLNRAMRHLNDILNAVPIDELRGNSSVTSNKILELGKRNRVLRAELETTKNGMRKKDNDIEKLKLDVKQLQEKLRKEMPLMAAKAGAASTQETAAELQRLQMKLFDCRNRNTELQTQLKRAQKCLQQEVGDKCDFKKALTCDNWRGRAELIAQLQKRLQQLRQRIQVYESQKDIFAAPPNTDSIKPTEAASEYSNTCAKTSNTKQRRRSKGGIERSSDLLLSPQEQTSTLLLRGKLEEAETESAELRAQLQDLRLKIQELKMNNKNIKEELLAYKSTAGTLVEQTECRDIDMARLQQELDMQQLQYQAQLEELKSDLDDAKRECTSAINKEEAMRSQLEVMEELLFDKDRFIQQQTENIQRLEEDLKAMSGEFLFKCRDFHKEEFMAVLDALDSEKNSLHEQLKQLQQRANAQSEQHSKLQEELLEKKAALQRCELKIQDLEQKLLQRKPKNKQHLDAFVSSESILEQQLQPTMQQQLAEYTIQLELAKEHTARLNNELAQLKEAKLQNEQLHESYVANSKAAILEIIKKQREMKKANMFE